MIAKITIRQVLDVEIDGKALGVFQFESDWEGMIKLRSSSPSQSVIIKAPKRPMNHFDLLPRMLGGNKPNGEQITIEAEAFRKEGGSV